MSRRGDIVVTPHAVERARERFGAGWPWSRIVVEVSDAMAAGRLAKRVPGSLFRPTHGARCCWSADGERVFVVAKRRTLHPSRVRGSLVWVVITCFASGSLSIDRRVA